uniref:Protein FAR1-RELATED SEQUENCE n=1 Tax=Cicer arietinum TaxID=3827 RepID=A0A1S3EHB5_CICAR|nr:protein FAR-RED IMPAIRED RESPONSE 1-like [Cicer arietinum]
MDCGTIEDEGIRVDNLDDDDNACCWEPATGMCFYCLEEVKSFYEEYASKKNFGWKIRSSRKGQGGEPYFFYDIDLDDDFHVRNVFWANGRSRAAYEYFGDVVNFDTTYLTNKYNMPFVAFVGVNHHGQSTYLDVECCQERPLWLGQYSEYKKIKFALKEAVYDTVTKEAFEEKWCSFIKKFELQQNDWLNGLYNERQRWAPTLLRKYFWAGMSTTQQSESIHSFFDGYINSTTSLNQFVKQYDNALKSRAEKEFEADFNSMDTTISCGSNSSIEKQFQGEYTRAKFKEDQTEFRSKMNCAASFYSVKELKPQIDRFDKLCKHFYEVVEVVAESEDATKALHEILYQFNSNVPTMDTTINKVKRSFIDASSPNNDNEIHSPLRVKRKGRPPSKRKISIVEKIVGGNTLFWDLLSQFGTTM